MLLTESSHVSFVYEENECSLVVLSTGVQDGGVYTCTARNLAGEVSCKAELAVRSGGLEFKGRRAKCLCPGIDVSSWPGVTHWALYTLTSSHILQPQHPSSGPQPSCSSSVSSIYPAYTSLCPIPLLP